MDKDLLPQLDKYGNIIEIDVPDYNKIDANDSLAVAEAKMIAQIKQYKEEILGYC